MMFDLINFSDINNKHGQHVGDEFLQLFAHALRANFRGENQEDPTRKPDSIHAVNFAKEIIASRIGGDEFAVLLKGGNDLTEESLHNLSLQKLVAVLSDPQILAKLDELAEESEDAVDEFGAKLGYKKFDKATLTYDQAITEADHKTHTVWSMVVKRTPEGFRHYFRVNKFDEEMMYEISENPYMRENSSEILVKDAVVYIPIPGVPIIKTN